MSNDNILFLGLTHGFLDDFKKLKEIFKKVHPKLILHESLENVKLISSYDYKKFLKDKKISNLILLEHVQKTINFCYKKKLPLIGIDFKNYLLNKYLIDKIHLNKRLSIKEKIILKKIMRKRENHHVKLIEKYNKLSEGPILICLGSWHLRRNSILVKKFKGTKIIFPSDKNGNLLTKSIKGKIKYVEGKI